MERMLKYYLQKNGMTRSELAGRAGLATVIFRKVQNSERDLSN